MDKLSTVQQIYTRLANLEEMREELRLTREHGEVEHMLKDIDLEMTALRIKAQEVLNNQCPLTKDKV